MRRLGIAVCLVCLLLAVGLAIMLNARTVSPKANIRPVKRDSKGWYDVPEGTTVGDLGMMVPATYEAYPLPWGLPSTKNLSTEQLGTFTGQIVIYDPKDRYSYLELEFEKGTLGPRQPPDSQEGLSRGTKHSIWKPVGNTIAKISENLPLGAEMRYFIHFSTDDKVKLPRDAHLLTHFTGFLTIRGGYPESSFDLDEGKVKGQSVTNPGRGADTFYIERREQMSWFEQLTHGLKP